MGDSNNTERIPLDRYGILTVPSRDGAIDSEALGRELSQKHRTKIELFAKNEKLHLHKYEQDIGDEIKILWLLDSTDKGFHEDTVKRIISYEHEAEQILDYAGQCIKKAEIAVASGNFSGYFEGHGQHLTGTNMHAIPWVKHRDTFVAADLNAFFDIDKMQGDLHVLAFQEPSLEALQRRIVRLYEGTWRIVSPNER